MNISGSMLKKKKKKKKDYPLRPYNAERYTNRELSWLEFNDRVLHEAMDERTPALERLRFINIFYSNLDEFYMKRVGGLKGQISVAKNFTTQHGVTAQTQLDWIRAKVQALVVKQHRSFEEDLRPALNKQGVFLLKWQDLSNQEKEVATHYFKDNIFPVLTPLSVDPGHPFPFISNLSVNFGITLKHPYEEDVYFSRIKIPKQVTSYILLSPAAPQHEYRFIDVIEVIQNNLESLFPGMEIMNVMVFKITRNADFEHDEEDAEDLLVHIEEELKERKFAECIRLEHLPGADSFMMELLSDVLELAPEDIYEVPGPEGMLSYDPLIDLNLKGLVYNPWTSVVPKVFQDLEENFFHVIKRNDVLVHHPYESFRSSVFRFIREAADDPYVLAIKMTLYRTGDSSPIVRSLIRAAENGKQVVVLIELKARFDEKRNIQWAQRLEKHGIHVVYGLLGFKTHSKISAVVRRDTDSIRTYVHIGTGNYNSQTAKLYTDLGLFTCHKKIAEDVIDMFHYLTGRSLKHDYKEILVAPINMKRQFIELIKKEIECHKKTGKGLIIAKMNSLEDDDICEALYEASGKGVEVRLIVRGFCCLKPQVKGLSENIKVISVIGRFLEHSRLFYFAKGEDQPIKGDFYIGSADWMYRNLHKRVEVIAPLYDEKIKAKSWEILQILWHDERQAWEMHSDGHYTQRKGSAEAKGSHEQLMQITLQREMAQNVFK